MSSRLTKSLELLVGRWEPPIVTALASRRVCEAQRNAPEKKVRSVLTPRTLRTDAQSTGGIAVTVLLNKVGLLVFAYLNAALIAWLLQQRAERKKDTG